MENPALEVECGEGLPVCDARSKEAWKNERESTPGCEKTHDSKVKQNRVRPILAEIKPQLHHTTISSLLHKLPSYFHQTGTWPMQEQARGSPRDCSWDVNNGVMVIYFNYGSVYVLNSQVCVRHSVVSNSWQPHGL